MVEHEALIRDVLARATGLAAAEALVSETRRHLQIAREAEHLAVDAHFAARDAYDRATRAVVEAQRG